MRVKAAVFRCKSEGDTGCFHPLLELFQVPGFSIDPAPDYTRISEIGESTETMKPEINAPVCFHGVIERLRQLWDNLRIHFTQKLEGEMYG